jgi:hypothetical protein
MRHTRMVRYAAVGAACAAVGTAAGITQSGAATHAGSAAKQHGRGGLRRAVHAEAVVPTAGGTRFVTVTLDRGTVQSVSGTQLVVSEGTATATYKTVTLTIPANATVRNNGTAAQLSSLKQGEIVRVLQAPGHVRVVAHQPGVNAR